MRVTLVHALTLTCVLTIIAMPAKAKLPLNVEITPLIGYRFGGDFDLLIEPDKYQIDLKEKVSYGLLTAWSYDRQRQGEFLISHYNTNFTASGNSLGANSGLGVTYAHLGGNVPISEGPIPFFVTGGLGLTHFDPQNKQLSNETRFSVNIGLATKIELSERVSLRLDSRLYGTFFNSDSAIFCEMETCEIYMSSNIWLQSEVSAGISYRF